MALPPWPPERLHWRHYGQPRGSKFHPSTMRRILFCPSHKFHQEQQRFGKPPSMTRYSQSNRVHTCTSKQLTVSTKSDISKGHGLKLTTVSSSVLHATCKLQTCPTTDSPTIGGIGSFGQRAARACSCESLAYPAAIRIPSSILDSAYEPSGPFSSRATSCGQPAMFAASL